MAGDSGFLGLPGFCLVGAWAAQLTSRGIWAMINTDDAKIVLNL